jgi:hypothetical protein
MNKIDELRVNIIPQRPDVIAVTETWLHSEILNSELNLPGYQIFRQDRRTSRKGGGLILYINNNLAAMRVNQLPDEFPELEIITVKIKIPNSPNLTLAVIYRSPTQQSTTDDLLLSELKNICKQKESIIIGDFNAPSIDWSMNYTNNEVGFDRKLLNFALDNFLYQNVKDNTRFRDGQTPHCLDLIFTNDEESIQLVNISPPLGLSDHSVLQWRYKIFPDLISEPRYKRSVWKADLQGMSSYLDTVPWEENLTDDLEQAWCYFKNVVSHIFNNYCPSVPIYSRNRPSWLTASIKQKIKKKARAWNLARSTNFTEHLDAYKSIRNECKKLIEESRKLHDTKIFEEAIENPKTFYAYINSKMKSRDQIESVISPDGNIVSDNHQKAQILNDFFQSVFTNEPELEGEEPDPNESRLLIADINIEMRTVKESLQKLNSSKASGPDAIPTKILKDMSEHFAFPLLRIFSMSLEHGVLPLDWKTADIAPIYKGGQKHAPNSFRPISLTCVCCKILERIIKSSLVHFLESNNLLSNAQFGFRQNRSCVMNLLLCMEHWTKQLDNGVPVDVVYIDFRKAFDSVPHQRLLVKLARYGITGNLYNWIKQFVTGRTQRVCIGDGRSSWVPVRSGVPQGSVLGPLLFLLYVDDIRMHVDCDMVMFADDLKLWIPINTVADEQRMQTNLDALQEWTDKWLLNFNTTKCVTLHLSSSAVTSNHQYSIGDHLLENIEVEKDLGVLIESTLKPTLQCVKASNRAMSIMRRIKRSFKCITPTHFSKVYTTYVRPHLEYSIQAWRPWFKKDSLLLSNVQRRSTKLVIGLSNYSANERESMLNLFSLDYRQLRGDLIMAFQIIRNQHCSLKCEDFFTMASTTNLRGHPWKVKKMRSRLLLRHNFFSQRVVNPWNALPASVVSSPNVDIFKARLDDFLLPTLNI